MNKTIAWHGISWEEVINKLGSDVKKGLTDEGAIKKQKEFGENTLPKEKPLSKVRIFLEQFKSPLIYILVIAGVVVLFFKEYTDAIVIFSAVFLNIIVGFIQENKASSALEKLKKIVKVEAQIIRNGHERMIDSSDIVPGDIFILSPGEKVPADGRIINSTNLKINEMSLTGEWLPADKQGAKLLEKTPLADRDNMVYMGTIVDDGKARIIATATGAHTEIGKIVQMVKEAEEEKTPLQKKLSHFSLIIGIVIAVISIFIFLEGLIKGGEFIEMFTTAVAVSVAAIPEGLPVAMTVILAIGMQRILKKKGLVRRLASTETLGSTSIIATDKTGTLTEGKMKVSKMVVSGKNERRLALKIITLCNEAFIENPEDSMDNWIVRGRPTDKALLMAGIQAGISRGEMEEEMTLSSELPFTSANKYMAKVYSLNKDEDILYVLGAPEKILEMSKSFEDRKEMEKEIEELTGKGLRVLAIAHKRINSLSSLFKDLSFVGLVALEDPIRKEVKEAIRTVREAGMKPIIVTGDHKLTAKAIAEELGFNTKEENIMEGKELEDLTDKQLEEVIDKIEVFARVEPKHKLRIVQAWQNKGEVIAMTGDGINDAPALKKADIGVALGSGTEVAKDISDLILLSDNFNIIVAAVEEGRAIIDNIRKVITYLLSDSFTETILVGAAVIFGFPLPLIAVQILWVNIIEDGLPGIALAFEPKEEDIMKQKPIKKKEALLNKEMKVLIFVIGLITDLFLLALFFWLWKNSGYDLVRIRTIIFAALTIDSLLYVFSCKSLRKNLWYMDFLSNKFLNYAWLASCTLLLASIYLPPFQILLKTVPLAFSDWIIILTLGIIKLFLIELIKWLFITKHIKE
ncbi:HAD-IC family P-type ATPase [Patescibacteria group bacterium]|nr:HAD-IC family P-type ATPase [Patescibacteria group bacterium]